MTRSRLVIPAACLAAILGCARPANVHQPALDAGPLIERARLFGGSSVEFSRVSPDGKWLSWLALHNGVMNIWVAPVAAPSEARVVTQETVDRVASYVWSPDSTSLLYTRDRGGNQNFVIHAASIAGAPVRALTPEGNARAAIVAVSPLVKDRILVGLNNRDQSWNDLHSLDLASGELTLVMRNDGYASFVVDPSLAVRMALRARPDGGLDVFKVESGRVAAAAFESIPYEDVRTTSLLGISADGRTLYWRDSRGRDTAALIAQDLRTGARTVIGSHPRGDVMAATAHPTTNEIDGYEVNPLTSEWIGLTASTTRDLEFLAGELEGEIEINARTDNDDIWVVLLKAGNRPATHHLFDRKSRRITKVLDSRPELEGVALGDKQAVSIRTRDGLTQTAYLQLPPGSDRDQNGRPDVPLPMVIFVHGGPWERTTLAYQANLTFIASRGYAVLAPNFRGSTGFGKAYVSAADGEWGAKMQDDLVDAADWAVAQGIAVEDKVGLYGGSYGGYAVLAALAFTPGKFACGIDLFGASDLAPLVESNAARNASRRAEYFRRIGDPTTATGRAFLAARSPISRVDAITRPLLIAHGAIDSNVKQFQSDQMVEALRARGAPVTYVVFADEGHGFIRPENVIAHMATTENFLAHCLGGRAEPFGESLAASSISVPQGAEFVPGLQAALGQVAPPRQ